MVVIPEKDDFVRVPYSDIEQVKAEDHKLVISRTSGGKVTFSKMAAKLDLMNRILSGAMNDLSGRVQSMVKELQPDLDPIVLGRISRFMREGKAAKRSDIESIVPEFWGRLEKKMEAAGISEEYGFLKTMSRQEKMCIGLKRGLMGDLTEEYIWFLIPIYSTDPSEPGNAIAMESTAGEGKGGATYFFRILSRADYSRFEKLEDLDKAADSSLARINKCMIVVNFRREPIYLQDERLAESEYSRYLFSIRRIPELRLLRDQYIGRVIHSSPEQWRRDVMSLLKFNVITEEDKDRWTSEEAEDRPPEV